ncbi:pyridoxal kinase PdxY [Pseudochrobactrum sp. MP213Fo]|uniref:pyridoxal kinase PdxY n=1 Tax=Pseudochrobactrum sp. MP213Fo TaxID=3022250 RepID=UPI003B9E24DF
MTASAPTSTSAVIVISSHVVRGSIGNRAAVFALERLGHPVWEVPTVILPWHPGHGPAGRIIPDEAQFSTLIADIERAPWLDEVSAVLTGFMSNAAQVKAVAHLIATLKLRNPKLQYICDPVIGDTTGLYVAEATAVAIRDLLLPLADIATPNRYELGWLTQSEPTNNQELMEAAMRAGPDTMLITSAFALMRDSISNVLVSRTQALMAEHRIVQGPGNGMGDLTSAVFLARKMSGMNDEKALQTTTAAVFEILARAAKRGSDELMLEADASSLERPMAMVQLRRLVHPDNGMSA